MEVSENLKEVIEFHNNIQKKIYGLDKKWEKLTKVSISKFNEKSVENKIKNFRKEKYLIHDLYPTTNYANLDLNSIKYLLKNLNLNELLKFIKERLPSSIMQRELQRDIIHNLEKLDCQNLLNEFDVSKTPGSPYFYKYKNYKFNMRWVRYIYFIKLYEIYIKKKFSTNDHLYFIDIGGGYGAFSELLKRKQSNSTNIIVDFPNQLSLAYYYLKSFNNKYSVGTVLNFEEKTINQEEIKNFDFFLLPTTYFKQLKIKQVDLITNFFSFGEMKEDQLAEYLNSEIFINSKIIFLSNRVFSNPNKTLYNEEDYDEKNSTYYDCNTTINDYHLHKYSKVFFDKNPVYPYLIKNKKILFFEKINSTSEIFDFIGEKK